MWYFASSSRLPSAAEDGQAHRTNGGNPGDDCTVGAYLGNGCPGDSNWRGYGNVFYHGAAGEPFDIVPTYYATRKCFDKS